MLLTWENDETCKKRRRCKTNKKKKQKKQQLCGWASDPPQSRYGKKQQKGRN
jgi:hypothetical protein